MLWSLFDKDRRSRKNRCTHRSRLAHCEPLEDRRLLAVFTVTNLNDAGPGSLRDAIAQADARVGRDAVVFSQDLEGGTIGLSSGGLTIHDSVTIDARSLSQLTIDAGPLDVTPELSDGGGGRAFDVLTDFVEFQGLTIRGGDVLGNGGAIRASGWLTVEGCQFIDNRAIGDGGAIWANVSGIQRVTIRNSTFSGNGKIEGSLVSPARGGALFAQFDSYGGDFLIPGYSLTIEDSTFSNNGNALGTGPGLSGGAIYLEGTTENIKIVDSTIEGNHAAGGNGGGIAAHLDGGEIIIRDTVLTGNVSTQNENDQAGHGGGIWARLNGGSMVVEDSTLENNVADNRGGGLHALLLRSGHIANGLHPGIDFAQDGGSLRVTGTQLTQNHADGEGGGSFIYASYLSNAVVEYSVVHENSSGAQGGGFYLRTNDGRIDVSKTTMSGNTAVSSGGGVAAMRELGDMLKISQSTIANNVVSNGQTAGGGVYVDAASQPLEIKDSIVAGNQTGGQDDDLAGAVEASHSLFQFTSTESNITGDENLIGVDPLLGPLADNGGDTLTHALLEGSPAIDSGSISLDGFIFDLAFVGDQRRNPYFRFTDGDGDGSTVIDRGALEVQPNAFPSADVSRSANRGAVNVPILMDGSASFDGNRDELSFTWSVTMQPAGSSPTFEDPTAEITSLTTDVPGLYRVQLVVNDGKVDSFPKRFLVNVSENQLPLANVSLSESRGAVISTIDLNGSRSSDPEGQPLEYSWSVVAQPPGSSAEIDNPTAQITHLFADTIGSYRIRLVVNDGTQDSAPVLFTIGVDGQNQPLVADASRSQTAGPIGVPITLDGSASFDPEREPLSFSWSVVGPAGSNFEIADPTAEQTTLTVDTLGTYSVQLVVSNPFAEVDTDTITIDVGLNAAPSANVSLSQSAGSVGAPVILDGTRSTDPESQPLTYRWSILAMPTGSNAEIDDPTAATTTLMADTRGAYRVRLIVNDGIQDSAPRVFNVNVAENQPPTAQVVEVGGDHVRGIPVLLNGAESSDPEQQPLSFAWQIISAPAGSNATIDNPSAAVIRFDPDQIGLYRVQLVVGDGNLDSQPVIVEINVSENQPPVANVSSSQSSGIAGLPGILDGTLSNDAEGQPLSYRWELISLPTGSAAEIRALTAGEGITQFRPDVAGTYQVRLTVNDGVQDSAPVTFVVNVAENEPPLANVSRSQSSGVVGIDVRLNGTASTDPEGQPLDYLWEIITMPQGAPAEIARPNVGVTSLVADTTGLYRLRLTVNDGLQDSAPVSFTVNVTDNRPPVANVSLSQSRGTTNNPVRLDGQASTDPDGHALSYDWQIVALPEGASAPILNPNGAVTAFTPDSPGLYRVQLIVNDGDLDSAPVRFTVNVDSNQPPVANVSLSESFGVVGRVVSLDGSRSSDPENQPLTYLWEIIAKPDASNAQISPDRAQRSFLSPDLPGLYRIRLTVNDGVQSDSATFPVSVTANQPPIADASLSDTTGITGLRVNLDGSRSSDPEGRPLSYFWEIVSKPEGSNATAHEGQFSSFTPDLPGSYRVKLRVADAFSVSAPAFVDVEVVHNDPPVPNVSLSQNAGIAGFPITLDASRSTDPDGDPLQYFWWILRKPFGSTSEIEDHRAAVTQFTPDMAGLYRVQVQVGDGNFNGTPLRFWITVADNRRPLANVSLSQSSGVVGSPVILNGTRSTDPEGQPLTYLWEIVEAPAGAAVVVEEATAAATQFFPDVAGSYRVRLTVNDGFRSGFAQFIVNVVEAGSAPELQPQRVDWVFAEI